MAHTIWKYVLKTETNQIIEIPEGAKILSAGEQLNNICVWVNVDTEMPVVNRKFSIYGTGHLIPKDPGDFIGSVHLYNGTLIFHVYAY